MCKAKQGTWCLAGACGPQRCPQRWRLRLAGQGTQPAQRVGGHQQQRAAWFDWSRRRGWQPALPPQEKAARARHTTPQSPAAPRNLEGRQHRVSMTACCCSFVGCMQALVHSCQHMGHFFWALHAAHHALPHHGLKASCEVHSGLWRTLGRIRGGALVRRLRRRLPLDRAHAALLLGCDGRLFFLLLLRCSIPLLPFFVLLCKGGPVADGGPFLWRRRLGGSPASWQHQLHCHWLGWRLQATPC